MKRNGRRTDFSNWDPFRELTSLQGRMNQIFQNAFGNWSDMDRSRSLISGSGFTPAADVYEDDNSLKVRLEIPGIQADDINITLDSDVLTVRGERKLVEGEKEDNYLRIERPYGPFFRSFTLPNSVDPSTLRANYDNGVLELTMTKRAEARPKQIKVNATQKALGAGATAEKAA